MYLPNKIHLEASSRCQLRCKGCATTLKLTTPVIGSGFLSINNFKKVLIENENIKNIEISNWGEVFLNPDIIEIFKTAFENNIILDINNGTNLNYATDDILESLVKYKINKITCSIDGTSQETYSQYRIGGEYEKIIKHIEKINFFKEKYKSQLPILTWQFVVFGYNEHEIPTAKELAKKYNMNIKFKISRERDNPSPIKNEEWVKKQLGIHYATREEFYQKTKTDIRFSICDQLWKSPQFNWDGKNLGCCVNYKGDFGGNLFDDGFEKCFNSEKMNYARKMLKGEAPPREDIPCVLCKTYQRMRESNVFKTTI